MLFLEYPACSTCKKAKKWLDDNGIVYTARHIKEQNPSAEELALWQERSGLELKKFFNTSGLLYKSMNLKEKLPTMSEEEQLEYDRKRAEMVRDVITGTSSEAEGASSPDSVDEDEVELRYHSDDDIVFSLDDEFTDDGVNYPEDSKRPFRCMFIRDEKLKEGQRVTLRLLETYEENGVRIPANSHLNAICKIGNRLELNVKSVEMNGKIIPLNLCAYDTDGLKGIYCPETSSNKNAKKAENDALSASGATFGGLVGDIANTIIRTGVNIARSSSGEVSVNVSSGYEFFLVKSERR